jgi:hypothetical protein
MNAGSFQLLSFSIELILESDSVSRNIKGTRGIE